MQGKRKIKKVLVVDDDRIITTLLKKYLEDNGYEVTAKNEASEGLEYAMTRKPDLIILDVMMPIINGFNFCRLIKAEEDSKNIPIILLTSRNKLKDIEIGLEMGAEAYLIKPLNIEELLRTIKVVESAE
jgi:two-component system alkaline phosphatase synthesis response regulator PhoP